MTHTVALNVDLGELADEPEELYSLADVVNVACGGHAGDAASMKRAVELAAAAGARVAAHPSYPDREGFGRRSIEMSATDLRDEIASQCRALQQIAGGTVTAVKLHGALYHDAARDAAFASAVFDGAFLGLGARVHLWIGPPAGLLRDRALTVGLVYAPEGFADRGTAPDGSLIPRGHPGALLEDPQLAAAQALTLARSGRIDTLCVHSDTPGAVAIARAVRAALTDAGLLGRLI